MKKNEILESLKAKVETLWSQIQKAPFEEQKKSLRAKYRDAYSMYKLQLEIVNS